MHVETCPSVNWRAADLLCPAAHGSRWETVSPALPGGARVEALESHDASASWLFSCPPSWLATA
jgi:hypothetical protein